MTYSIIGLLAIAIHLILNYEVFRPQNKKDSSEVKRSFRYFMLADLVAIIDRNRVPHQLAAL